MSDRDCDATEVAVPWDTLARAADAARDARTLPAAAPGTP